MFLRRKDRFGKDDMRGLKLTRSEGGFTVSYDNGTDYGTAFEVSTFAEASSLLREAVVLGGRASDLDAAWYGPGCDEGPFCSICDALGHGYPGGGPCPLEDAGYWEADRDEDEEARRGILSFSDAWDLAGR